LLSKKRKFTEALIEVFSEEMQANLFTALLWLSERNRQKSEAYSI